MGRLRKGGARESGWAGLGCKYGYWGVEDSMYKENGIALP